MPANRPVHTWPFWSRGRALFGSVLLINLLVGGLLYALAIYVVSAGHQAYATQAADTVEDLAAIANEDVSSELSRVDAVLQSAILAV